MKITTIALDHEAWLGHDLASIAAEKAGILKPGVPLALGPVPPEADAVISARAAGLGVPVVRAGAGAVIEEHGGRLTFQVDVTYPPTSSSAKRTGRWIEVGKNVTAVTAPARRTLPT